MFPRGRPLPAPPARARSRARRRGPARRGPRRAISSTPRLCRQALVAGLLELVGELRAAVGHDAARHEHVDAVGPQLGEQARVVRDREDAEVVVAGHRLDPARHVAQRVDVETRVDLVEDGEARLQHRELQRLDPLLLAPGELVVHAPLEELVAHAESRRFGARAAGRGRRARSPPRPHRGREEVAHRARPGPRPGTACAGTDPRAARCHVGRPRSSSPSRVTEPAVTA